jgi:hypothetical protein
MESRNKETFITRMEITTGEVLMSKVGKNKAFSNIPTAMNFQGLLRKESDQVEN